MWFLREPCFNNQETVKKTAHKTPLHHHLLIVFVSTLPNFGLHPTWPRPFVIHLSTSSLSLVSLVISINITRIICADTNQRASLARKALFSLHSFTSRAWFSSIPFGVPLWLLLFAFHRSQYITSPHINEPPSACKIVCTNQRSLSADICVSLRCYGHFVFTPRLCRGILIQSIQRSLFVASRYFNTLTIGIGSLT